MKKTAAIPIGLLSLLVATNAYWLIQSRSPTTQSPQTTTVSATYPYLSKRIFAENQNDILINFAPLRKQLEAKFATLPTNTQHSFYFEYLPSGTSIRIGSDNELIAASLIKVPLVMNLYHAAELGRIDLDQKYTITQDDLDSAYGSLWEKGVGTKISLREAARYALTESDNTAAHMIFTAVQPLLKEDEQSLAQLDVDQNITDGQAVINAKSYTSVLKSLYFASYVNKSSSQEILGFLSNSTEDRRITGLLPSNVTVAHKNGVYNADWAESDCGIVYAEKRPYAICIMIGLPESEANTFMAETSKIIHDYVRER